jgi:adenylate kinase family enzyme
MDFMEFRILILGYPSSGKSTLAKAISRELLIPHIEADKLTSKKDMSGSEVDLFLKEVRSRINENNWIFEGHFKTVKDIIFTRANLVIFLNSSAIRIFYGLFLRDISQCLFFLRNRHRLKNNYDQALQTAMVKSLPILVRETKENRSEFVKKCVQKVIEKQMKRNDNVS